MYCPSPHWSHAPPVQPGLQMHSPLATSNKTLPTQLPAGHGRHINDPILQVASEAAHHFWLLQHRGPLRGDGPPSCSHCCVMDNAVPGGGGAGEGGSIGVSLIRMLPTIIPTMSSCK